MTHTGILGATTTLAITLAALPVFADGSGAFDGRNGHVTTGSVTVDADGRIELGADFSFDGAPDPVVGLGRDGTYDPASMAGELQAPTGAQSYSLPGGAEAADYNEAYVWCREFGVALGVATLN